MVSDPAADNRLRFWASLPSVRRITILDPLAAGHARALEGVDSRDKPGQDEISGSFCSVIRPQDFPRTAL